MKLSKIIIGAVLIAIAGSVPAHAWQVSQRDRGFVVAHADDDIRFALVCSPDRPEGLAVRVVGLSLARVDTITMRMTQSSGRVAEYSARPREDADEITGVLPASATFLEDFRNGIRFQLLVNNTVYMDTGMTGTSSARAAIQTACGI